MNTSAALASSDVDMDEPVAALGNAQARRRPPVALSSCYRELNASLHEYLLRNTRSRHDAEDLAQEVYLRLARMRCLASIEDQKAFVFRAAKNLLRDRFRRAQTHGRQDSAEHRLLETCDLSAEPSLVFESLEMLQQIDRVLDSLKASTRRAFVRHRVEECAHVDIAAEMGVSISMVEKHVKAARAALRDAGICVDTK
jgi:RNA polymerase sigma factor (sigma-70 family)